MKNNFFFAAILLLSACSKPGHIHINGKVTGISNGTFVIKNQRDSVAYGDNITNGAFHIDKIMQQPGYYQMEIDDNAAGTVRQPHEVYLDTGTYTIEADGSKLFAYPKITSTSKIQQELSAFNALVDDLGNTLEAQLADAKRRQDPKASKDDYNAATAKISETQLALTGVKARAFKAFIEKYPQGTAAAHIMAGIDYEANPTENYALFKKLTPAAQSSDDGKEIGKRLSQLVKVAPGAKAPAIAGKTPDGKPFDLKAMGKKIILVDFWRTSDDVSRLNHQQMISVTSQITDKKDFGIVSVSMDKQDSWWRKSITDDKMDWPQVSDLKGDDSPNVDNWAITRIPTYYLVSGDGVIVLNDVQFNTIAVEVNSYLKHH